ncbi:hypothetical protein NKH77_16800 [Streptomyces sp. M19]
MQPLIHSAGGGTGLSGDKNVTPAVNKDQGWKKALTFYKGLFNQGISPKGIQYTQLPALFANGKIAYFLANTPALATFLKNPDLKFGVAPSPTFAGGEAATRPARGRSASAHTPSTRTRPGSSSPSWL